jgi:O-methyltransferase
MHIEETLNLLTALESKDKWLGVERARLVEKQLTLLQNCLSGSIYEDPPLQASGAKVFDPNIRKYGWDWPSVAHTMIGEKRLANVRELAENVLGTGIEGDFIETGVWRGGACILMRGVLDAWGDTKRVVWLADSFEGLPPPDADKYPADLGDKFYTYPELSVSLEQVKLNFEKYGLLDERVKFLKGWFKDTLHTAPIEKLAILRLDGDMYESTMDALTALYDRVSDGGYIIVDDYHVVEGCKKAIHDFLSSRNLSPKLIEIDGVGVYWKKIIDHAPSPLQTPVAASNQFESLKTIFELQQKNLQDRELEVQSLSKAKQEREFEVQSLSKAKQEREFEVQSLSKAKQERELEVQSLSKAKQERESELTMLKNQLNEIHNSTSWKITQPFRQIKNIISK